MFIFVGFASIVAVWVAKAIYQIFFSPLRHIRGPWLAKLTPYYIIFIDGAGSRTSHIHRLHQKYGEIVRIGPNEVSFSSPEAAAEIYCQATPYLKSPWYEAMSVPPVGIFAQRDRRKAADRRRLLGPGFSQAALNDVVPTVNALVLKLLDRISNLAERGLPVDALSSFRRLSLDIVGTLFLGQTFNALDNDKMPDFFDWMDNMFISLSIKHNFPVLYLIMLYLPFKSVQEMIQGPVRIAEYGKNAFNRYLEENGRESKRRDLLTKFLTANMKAEEAKVEDTAEDNTIPISDLEMQTEIGNMIFAGTDTTSSTLTYLFWELARNEGWQSRLRDELNERLASEIHDLPVPKYSDVVNLPILNAITDETLRLHPSAPASLPRSVPSDGRVIDGQFMPENVVISAQCYTLHRDRLAFPNPEQWDPSRWLDEGKVVDQERTNSLFLPFSRGPRSCLGKNLAIMELKITTALLVQKTRFRLAPGNTDDGMTMVDHFLVTPKAGKCELIFECL